MPENHGSSLFWHHYLYPHHELVQQYTSFLIQTKYHTRYQIYPFKMFSSAPYVALFWECGVTPPLPLYEVKTCKELTINQRCSCTDQSRHFTDTSSIV